MVPQADMSASPGKDQIQISSLMGGLSDKSACAYFATQNPGVSPDLKQHSSWHSRNEGHEMRGVEKKNGEAPPLLA